MPLNRKKFFSFFAFLVFSFFLFQFQLASAKGNALEDAKTSLETTAKNIYGVIPFDEYKNSPAGLIGILIGAVLAFVGVLFFALMIYGGILWMTAQGNEQQVGKAKELIRAAVIGIIIVFSAYVLTAFIGQILTAQTTTTV